jgi:membrane protease YdiL (CAAX protease family)
MENQARFPFVRTALAFWLLGIIGGIAILPFVQSLEGGVIAAAANQAHISLTTLLAAQMVQMAVLVLIAAFVGLWAARKVGLITPLVSALVSGRPLPRFGGRMVVSLLLGALAGAAILALDLYVFDPGPKLNLATGVQPEAWKGLLASLYGAFTEEMLLRLLVMSLIALILQAIVTGFRPSSRPMSLGVFWIANLLAAVLFGLGHLPATAALAPLSAMLVVRALVLNGLVGVVCGDLFRRWGLEFAMAAHFAADLVLHVAPPLVMGR